jgi:hypothetical protein
MEDVDRTPVPVPEKRSTKRPFKALRYPPTRDTHLASPRGSGVILVALMKRCSLVSL